MISQELYGVHVDLSQICGYVLPVGVPVGAGGGVPDRGSKVPEGGAGGSEEASSLLLRSAGGVPDGGAARARSEMLENHVPFDSVPDNGQAYHLLPVRVPVGAGGGVPERGSKVPDGGGGGSDEASSLLLRSAGGVPDGGGGRARSRGVS